MVGQELAKQFASYDLLLWDRDDLNITNRQQVFDKVFDARPSIIVNAAAYNAVDDAEADSRPAYDVNYEGPKNLAEASKSAGAVFVHYSTDYIFDGEKKDGYQENDNPNPISVYGKAKLAGEMAVREVGGKYYIIRPSRIFGAPAISEGAKKSFVDVMIGLAETRDELQVVDEEFSSPTYALDLAELTKKVVEDVYPYGVYHGANEGACTWYEFAQEIFRIIGKDIKIVPVTADTFPRPAKRPAFSSLINTKLPKQRTWQEALEAYLVERGSNNSGQ